VSLAGYALITCALSIVFVHGFGGHYTDTWTSEGVYWPQDFLKSKLERARIISFAYDAVISRFLPQDDDSVSFCASELLTNLTKLRADECQVRCGLSTLDARQFTMTLYACSATVRLFSWSTLSALLLSKTLVRNMRFPLWFNVIFFQALSHSSFSQPSGLEHVAQACRGVVFLGAAHRETFRKNFGQIAAKAAAVVQPSLKIEILRKLEGSSGAFRAINESFLQYLEKKGKTFKSITFYEKSVVSATGEVSGLLLYLITSHFIVTKVTVEHESARMDNWDHDLLGLTIDHCNMSKFVQLEDPNYLAISNAIKKIYEDIIGPQRPDCQVLFDCPNALLE
jgi:hypothetical protein